MDTLRICKQCQAPLPADAPEGLCPQCLLQAGLESTIRSDPEGRAPRVPLPSGEPANSGPRGAPSSGTTLRYFGDYELLDKIAEGGMGVVWKARQASLNRIVAVKTIRAGKFASADDVKRFHIEAEAAANLQHPNIVAIHEVGEHEGQHYFSMDYVAGKNLAELIQDEPLPATKAAALIKTIAEALQYAHQRGILHRDLKPQNVLIDEFGQPRITDFGLAKQMKRESSLTQTGAVMGSPSYMPPEQAAGRQDRIGPHSDVYSLGAVLYQLLTGHAPFEAETPMATLMKVVEEEPQAPSKLNPRVPRDLETICLKCLEKQPAQRYPTARELAEELERFLDEEPILAKPASTVRKAWFWLRKRPWAITGVVSLFALGLVALACGLWQQNRYLAWLQTHPGHIRTPGQLSRELKMPVIELLLCTVVGWAIRLQSYDTVRSRRRRYHPHFHVLLWVCGGYGVAAVLAGVYLALKSMEAHVWENHPLVKIGIIHPGLLLLCVVSGLTAYLYFSSLGSRNPDIVRLRTRLLRFIPSTLQSHLIIILGLAGFAGFLGVLSAALELSVTFVLLWNGSDLVRLALRERQSALSVSIDSHGLIPEEMQLIENFIFCHQRHEAEQSFQFYTSERGREEVAQLIDKSANTSMEAKAFIDNLSRQLQRKCPEKFLHLLTKEGLQKTLASIEKDIAALEALPLDKFSPFKSEEQRQQALAAYKKDQQFVRVSLADITSEGSATLETLSAKGKHKSKPMPAGPVIPLLIGLTVFCGILRPEPAFLAAVFVSYALSWSITFIPCRKLELASSFLAIAWACLAGLMILLSWQIFIFSYGTSEPITTGIIVGCLFGYTWAIMSVPSKKGG